jgi:hypothetical protein
MKQDRVPPLYEQLKSAQKAREEEERAEIELPVKIDFLLGGAIFFFLWMFLIWFGFDANGGALWIATPAGILGTLVRKWMVKRNPDWLERPGRKDADRDLPNEEL